MEDQQQASEELTLFSIAKTFNEDNKKAKKEKEKKEKKQSPVVGADEKPPRDEVKSKTTPVSAAQKRPNSSSSGQSTQAKHKNRRSSTGKLSLRSEDEENDGDDSEEEDEPKPKKKTNRLSVSINDDSFKESAPGSGSGVKRTSSSTQAKAHLGSEANAESETDKDTNSLDGTASVRSGNGTAANESFMHDTDLDTTGGGGGGGGSEKPFDKKTTNKLGLCIRHLDVNDLVKVKYGSGNQKQVYPAKVMQIDLEKNLILVHYNGWNTRYDEWVKIGRAFKIKGEIWRLVVLFIYLFI